MSKVSFIIPALGDCSADIEMAESLAVGGDEIIVVNGGEEIELKDPDVTYIEESDDSAPSSLSLKGGRV
jgi:hypothetical protein